MLNAHCRSIARFGQSLSMSINRSLKHSTEGLVGSSSLRSSLRGSLSKQPPPRTAARAALAVLLRDRSSSGCSCIDSTCASAAANISPTLLSAAASSELDQLLLLGGSEPGLHVDNRGEDQHLSKGVGCVVPVAAVADIAQDSVLCKEERLSKVAKTSGQYSKQQ
jgi:hypothetical protein